MQSMQPYTANQVILIYKAYLSMLPPAFIWQIPYIKFF